jgi:amidase
MSLQVPPPIAAGVAPTSAAAVEQTAALLRSLGHEVVERDPDYGTRVPRRARALPAGHPRRRGARCRTPSASRAGRAGTRGWARSSRRPRVARGRAAEAADARRINAIFDDGRRPAHAGVHARRCAIGEYDGPQRVLDPERHGALVPHLGRSTTRVSPRPRVPAPGSDPAGCPLSVQLVGRPDDESTLLSLSAQIEAERPWAQHRPPTAA